MNTGNESFQVDPISTNSTALLTIDYVLLSLTLPTAFLSIIFILLLIPMIFVDRKRYHQNLL
jgi:hypothetical protein